MEVLLDQYTRRARYYPALITLLPIVSTFLAWYSKDLADWGAVWGLIVYCGGTFLLAQMGRDLGKTQEPKLFTKWHGKPTIHLLRHRDNPNPVLLSRRHSLLQALLPDVRLPSVSEERSAPEHAEAVYEACTRFLITHTRDRKQFPLIFEENCNYGFRRNLWGAKPVALGISALCLAAVALLIGIQWSRGQAPQAVQLVCAAGNLVLLALWLIWFTPSWVKTAGEAYSERVVGCA